MASARKARPEGALISLVAVQLLLGRRGTPGRPWDRGPKIGRLCSGMPVRGEERAPALPPAALPWQPTREYDSPARGGETAGEDLQDFRNVANRSTVAHRAESTSDAAPEPGSGAVGTATGLPAPPRSRLDPRVALNVRQSSNRTSPSCPPVSSP